MTFQPFAPGDRVCWSEGKTHRRRRGVVRAVHVLTGWEDAPEYEVRIIRKDGTHGSARRIWHSELVLAPLNVLDPWLVAEHRRWWRLAEDTAWAVTLRRRAVCSMLADSKGAA